MALPKQRTSTQRKGKRRHGQKTMTLPHLIACPGCNEMKRPHQICPNCDEYKGRALKGKLKVQPLTKSKAGPSK